MSSESRGLPLVLVLVAALVAGGCGGGDGASPDLSGLSVDELLVRSRDGAAPLRAAACRRLGAFDDDRALARVREMVGDEDKMVQASAIHALGDRGDVRAVPDLEALVASPDPILPFHALAALVAVGGTTGLVPVVRTAGRTDELGAEARRLVLDAGAGRMVPVLTALAGDASHPELHATARSLVTALEAAAAAASPTPSPPTPSPPTPSPTVVAPPTSPPPPPTPPTPTPSAAPPTRPAPPVTVSPTPRPPTPRPPTPRPPTPRPTPPSSGPAAGWPDPSRVREAFMDRIEPEGGELAGAPESIEAFNAGVRAAGRGDTVGAIERYRAAVAVDGDFFEAWFNLAGLVEEADGLAAALPVWGQALRLRRGDPEVHFRIGRILEGMRRTRQAWAFYALAESLEPARHEAAFRAGLMAFKEGAWDVARPYLERAAARAPDREAYAVNLTALYLNMGLLDDAERAAARARSLGGDVTALEAEIARRRGAGGR